MRRRFSHFAARWSWLPWLISAGCQGCHVAPPVVPPPDASDAGDLAAQACASLAAAGCHVGASPTCAEAIRNDMRQGVGSQTQAGCIVAAGRDVTAIRACRVACAEMP